MCTFLGATDNLLFFEKKKEKGKEKLLQWLARDKTNPSCPPREAEYQVRGVGSPRGGEDCYKTFRLCSCTFFLEKKKKLQSIHQPKNRCCRLKLKSEQLCVSLGCKLCPESGDFATARVA